MSGAIWGHGLSVRRLAIGGNLRCVVDATERGPVGITALREERVAASVIVAGD
jgi:hypothetical protein